MGVIKNSIIKRLIKQIKKGKKPTLLKYVTAEDVFYKDEDGITLFEHIIKNQEAYNCIYPINKFGLKISFHDPYIIFLLAKYNKLNDFYLFYYSLDENSLFVQYENNLLLHYIINSVKYEICNKVLYKITNHIEVIDFLINENRINKISKLNPILIHKLLDNRENYELFEKYVNNDYVFVELMKLVEDKKIVYEICEKYNKLEFLNLILENEFEKIIRNNKPDDHLKQEFFAMENEDLLDKELLQLLNEFIELFKQELSRGQLEFLYNSLYQSLIQNNENVISFLITLIDIKKRYPENFKFTFNPKADSWYKNGIINFSETQWAPVVFFHENGHLIDHQSDEEKSSVILNEITRIRNNPEEFLKRFNEFKELYKKIQDEAYREAKEYYKEKFGLMSVEYEKYLLQLDLPEEIIKEVRNLPNIHEKFVKKQEDIICREYVTQYFLYKQPQLFQISDIIDAILGGNVRDYENMHGHGIKYYANINNCFNEIMACFIALMTLPSSEEYLEMLKNIIGETLFYEIERHCNIILTGEKESDDKIIL